MFIRQLYLYLLRLYNIHNVMFKRRLVLTVLYSSIIFETKWSQLPSEFHFFESVPPKLVFRWRDPPSGLLLCCLLGGTSECREATLSACLSTRSASKASSRLDALIFSLRTGVGTKWPSPSPAKASTILAASELPYKQTK